jgi:hypothetical protein
MAQKKCCSEIQLANYGNYSILIAEKSVVVQCNREYNKKEKLKKTSSLKISNCKNIIKYVLILSKFKHNKHYTIIAAIQVRALKIIIHS